MYRRSFSKLVWYRLTQWVLGLGIRLGFRFRARGTDRVPAEGPAVLVANHSSHLDPPLIGCFLRRPLGFLARDTLFTGLSGWIVRSYDAIPIDRDGSGLGGIRNTLKRLKQGDAVLMFPEGTRSPDGELQPLKPGFLSLVRRGKATIVPMALSGAYEALPRQRHWPRFEKIALQVAEPITPAEIADLTDPELLAEVTRRMAAALAAADALAGR